MIRRFLFLMAALLMAFPVRGDFWVQMGEKDPLMGFPDRPRLIYPEKFRKVDPYKSLTERLEEEPEPESEDGDGLENYGDGNKKNETVKSRGRKVKKFVDDFRNILYGWPELVGRPPEVWDFAEHCAIDSRSTAPLMAPSQAESAYKKGRVPYGSLSDINELYLIASSYRKYYKGAMKLVGAIMRSPGTPRVNQRAFAISLVKRREGGIRSALLLYEVSHKINKGYNCGHEVLKALTGKDHTTMKSWLKEVDDTNGNFEIDTTVLGRLKDLDRADNDELFVKALKTDKPSPLIRDYAILMAGRQRRLALSKTLIDLYDGSDADRQRLILLSLVWMADENTSPFLKKLLTSIPKDRKYLAQLAYCAATPKAGREILKIAKHCFGKFQVQEGEVFTQRHLRRFDVINLMVLSPEDEVRHKLWDMVTGFRVSLKTAGGGGSSNQQTKETQGPRVEGGTSQLFARALASMKLDDEVLPKARVVKKLIVMLQSERFVGRQMAEAIKRQNPRHRDTFGGVGEPLAIAAIARLFELDQEVGLKEAKLFQEGIDRKTQVYGTKFKELIEKIVKF